MNDKFVKIATNLNIADSTAHRTFQLFWTHVSASRPLCKKIFDTAQDNWTKRAYWSSTCKFITVRAWSLSGNKDVFGFYISTYFTLMGSQERSDKLFFSGLTPFMSPLFSLWPRCLFLWTRQDLTIGPTSESMGTHWEVSHQSTHDRF